MGASGAAFMLKAEDFRKVPVCREFREKLAFRKLELIYLMGLDMIDGYHLQFGVHRGATLNHMARLKPWVHWYGFDSMEGLPHKWVLGKKEVPADKFRITEPPELEPNATFVKGWFNETVAPFAESMKRPAAFMDIDSDVYESARDVLFGMNKRIVPGTVIRFDELCEWREFGMVKHNSRSHMYEHWREHEWKALMEWLDECGREVEPIHRTDSLAGTVRVTK